MVLGMALVVLTILGYLACRNEENIRLKGIRAGVSLLAMPVMFVDVPELYPYGPIVVMLLAWQWVWVLATVRYPKAVKASVK